ncbi:MAG: hypothetical protein Q7Q73_10070 [Verrucomicrobiota bacterium JB024]|nr:hypothetical protein [Verrucomicrobiota bacterium JB024]
MVAVNHDRIDKAFATVGDSLEDGEGGFGFAQLLGGEVDLFTLAPF